MEGNNQNKLYIKEALERRAEARKEAIRKKEEAHAKFERVMIRTVNVQHADATRNRDIVSATNSADKAKENKAVREFKRKRALARAIADGDDYMLQMQVCGGAFLLADILGRIGIVPMGASVAVRVLLVAWFCYNIYRLYQVSGAIAKLSDGGE